MHWLDLLTKPNNWVSTCVHLPTNLADFFAFLQKKCHIFALMQIDRTEISPGKLQENETIQTQKILLERNSHLMR